MLNTTMKSIDNNNKLNLLYQGKIRNIEENYNKIKKYLILILSESNSKLNTYATIYNQINGFIEFNNKYKSFPIHQYLYLNDKHKNSVNALINLIIIKEIELEDVRLRIFMTKNKINMDIYQIIKSFICTNSNIADNYLANIVYPKLLSVLEKAKNSFTPSEI